MTTRATARSFARAAAGTSGDAPLTPSGSLLDLRHGLPEAADEREGNEMATTIADIRKAATNAKRSSYEISAEQMTNERRVRIWLTELQVLEARIRRYAEEHGVAIEGGPLS